MMVPEQSPAGVSSRTAARRTPAGSLDLWPRITASAGSAAERAAIVATASVASFGFSFRMAPFPGLSFGSSGWPLLDSELIVARSAATV